MVEAIAREAELRKDFFAGLDGRSSIEIENHSPTSIALDTLYFGGGTPSLLEASDWDLLTERLWNSFDFVPDPEFTVECNPDDLSPERLAVLHAAGVNRLSIGVQSFRDQDLTLMNRSHNAGQASRSIEDARKAGFANITADLIYGIPGLSLKAWEENIRRMIDLGVDHISAYALTVEERTALYHQVEKGTVDLPNDQTFHEHYYLLIELLGSAEFEHYELSNFARPGFRSRHNSSYWEGEPYLGLGPSAHSYCHPKRAWNVSNNAKYLKLVEAGKLPEEASEELSVQDQINEYLMTHLRKTEGIDLERLQGMGHDLRRISTQEIASYEKEGLLIDEGNRIRLTPSGLMLSNEIISEFFLA